MALLGICKLGDDFKSLLGNDSTVFLLDSDIASLHVDREIIRIIDLTRAHAYYGLYRYILTFSQDESSPGLSIVEYIWFFVDRSSQSMTREIFDDMKSAPSNLLPDHGSNISCRVSCLCLLYAQMQSISRCLDDVQIFWSIGLPDNNCECSICE